MPPRNQSYFTPGSLGGLLGSLGSGAVRGIAGLGDIGVSALTAATGREFTPNPNAGFLSNIGDRLQHTFLGSRPLGEALESTGLLREPQGTSEEFASTIGEFAGPGGVFKAGKGLLAAGRGALGGGVAGLGSESLGRMAGEISPDFETAGRIAGGLVTPSIAGQISRTAKPLESLTQEQQGALRSLSKRKPKWAKSAAKIYDKQDKELLKNVNNDISQVLSRTKKSTTQLKDTLKKLPPENHQELENFLKEFVVNREGSLNIPKTRMTESGRYASEILNKVQGKTPFTKIDTLRQEIGKKVGELPGAKDIYEGFKDYIQTAVPNAREIISEADTYRQASIMNNIITQAKKSSKGDTSVALNKAANKLLSPTGSRLLDLERLTDAGTSGSSRLNSIYNRLEEFAETFPERGGATSKLSMRAAERSSEIAPGGLFRSGFQKLKDVKTKNQLTQSNIENNPALMATLGYARQKDQPISQEEVLREKIDLPTFPEAGVSSYDKFINKLESQQKIKEPSRNSSSYDKFLKQLGD